VGNLLLEGENFIIFLNRIGDFKNFRKLEEGD